MKRIIGYDEDGHTLYEELGPAVGRGGLSHRQKRIRNGLMMKALEKTKIMSNKNRKSYLNAIQKKELGIDNFKNREDWGRKV